MKTLVGICLAFFLTTFTFVVGHNVVHHEDEPVAFLPSAGTPPPATAPAAPSDTAPPDTAPADTAPADTAPATSPVTTAEPVATVAETLADTSTADSLPVNPLAPTTTAAVPQTSATTVPQTSAPTSTLATRTTPPTTAPVSPGTVASTAPKLVARLPLTVGASAASNVADGRQQAEKLIATAGSGTAKVFPADRGVELSAKSNGADGRSIWFGVIGSDLTFVKGDTTRAVAVVRIDGVTWRGRLISDGGAAAAELRLQVQDGAGEIVGNVLIDEVKRDSAGTTDIDPKFRTASVEVPVELPAGKSQVVLRAYLYVKVDAQGGKGATSVELAGDHDGKRYAATYGSIAVAIGQAPPAPTAPPPGAVPGQGITAGQLSVHNSADSCWLLINGRVYDVTAFLRKHPGSQDPVLKVCGKEATEAFATQGGRGSRHSYDAVDKLQQYYIGDYVG